MNLGTESWIKEVSWRQKRKERTARGAEKENIRGVDKKKIAPRNKGNGRGELTLAISLNTEIWASSNSFVTSFRLSIMAESWPTALVMRVASWFRSKWSMLSSQGEPGARKAL